MSIGTQMDIRGCLNNVGDGLENDKWARLKITGDTRVGLEAAVTARVRKFISP